MYIAFKLEIGLLYFFTTSDSHAQILLVGGATASPFSPRASTPMRACGVPPMSFFDYFLRARVGKKTPSTTWGVEAHHTMRPENVGGISTTM